MSMALAMLLVIASLGVAAHAQRPDAARESEFAPGRITRYSGGWNAWLNSGYRHLPLRSARDAPADVAPFAALFDARPHKTALGYSMYTSKGTVRLTKRYRGFEIETPTERFEAIERFNGEWELRPIRTRAHPPSVQPPSRKR